MTFWTQTLGVFDICTDVQFKSHMSVRLPNSVHFTFWGDLTKPTVIMPQWTSLKLGCWFAFGCCIVGVNFC